MRTHYYSSFLFSTISLEFVILMLKNGELVVGNHHFCRDIGSTVRDLVNERRNGRPDGEWGSDVWRIQKFILRSSRRFLSSTVAAIIFWSYHNDRSGMDFYGYSWHVVHNGHCIYTMINDKSETSHINNTVRWIFLSLDLISRWPDCFYSFHHFIISSAQCFITF